MILIVQIVATSTCFARHVKSSIDDAYVQRLAEMGLLEERDNIFTGNIRALLKRPPTDQNAQEALVHFKISTADCESSFNGSNPFIFNAIGELTCRAAIKRPSDLKEKFSFNCHRLMVGDE